MAKINASDAMLKVIESWGVKNIYGLPGGSFDSTMNALHNRKATLNYVQVRHEEVGALAAVGEAKVTGKIGVTFGSAGLGRCICSMGCMMRNMTMCQFWH